MLSQAATLCLPLAEEEKTAWETWKVFPEVSDAFLDMTNILGGEISDACIIQLERLVVLMYDRTSECLEVNEARKQLFIQKSRTLETIPPTKAALEQHIKRASYQARCWSQALVQNPQLPSPSVWEWIKKEGEWHPIWTTLDETAKSYCIMNLFAARANKAAFAGANV